MTLFLACVVTFSLSWLLTRLMRAWALRANLLDVPNDRSSHSIPTPRGGGVAFVLCFLLAMLLLLWLDVISLSLFSASAGMGFFVAVLGFLDDRYHLSAKWRLACHFLIAAITVYWLLDLTKFTFFQMHPMLAPVAEWVAIFYLVWLLNLFNFMDGLDGLAAAESICICAGAALIYWLNGMSDVLFGPLILVAAVGGFLVCNFPPARIFMGDVGSGFLGYIIGVFSLQGLMLDSPLFWSWFILSGFFITDATFTLLRRGLRGARLFEAHRSHAYQKAAHHFGEHRIVTTSVIAVNLFWLCPIAYMVSQRQLGGITGVIIAYLPLLILVVKFNAGQE